MRYAVTRTEPVPLCQLKITLEDVRPPVWRRVLVPQTYSLPRLHRVFQAVLGWENSHLHAFRVGETVYGEPEADLDDWMQNETRVRLAQIAPDVKSKFLYEYDFGDGWGHTVVVEKILPAEPGQTAARCLAGKRACPPEDCGGPWGYANFLEAIANPNHKEHALMRDWIGGEFDPAAFDLDAVNAELHRLRL